MDARKLSRAWTVSAAAGRGGLGRRRSRGGARRDAYSPIRSSLQSTVSANAYSHATAVVTMAAGAGADPVRRRLDMASASCTVRIRAGLDADAGPPVRRSRRMSSTVAPPRQAVHVSRTVRRSTRAGSRDLLVVVRTPSEDHLTGRRALHHGPMSSRTYASSPSFIAPMRHHVESRRRADGLPPRRPWMPWSLAEGKPMTVHTRTGTGQRGRGLPDAAGVMQTEASRSGRLAAHEPDLLGGGVRLEQRVSSSAQPRAGRVICGLRTHALAGESLLTGCTGCSILDITRTRQKSLTNGWSDFAAILRTSCPLL